MSVNGTNAKDTLQHTVNSKIVNQQMAYLVLHLTRSYLLIEKRNIYLISHFTNSPFSKESLYLFKL